ALDRDDRDDLERDRIHDHKLVVEDETPEVTESRDDDDDFLGYHEQAESPRHEHADADREAHVRHSQARHEVAADNDLANPAALVTRDRDASFRSGFHRLGLGAALRGRGLAGPALRGCGLPAAALGRRRLLAALRGAPRRRRLFSTLRAGVHRRAGAATARRGGLLALTGRCYLLAAPGAAMTHGRATTAALAHCRRLFAASAAYGCLTAAASAMCHRAPTAGTALPD